MAGYKIHKTGADTIITIGGRSFKISKKNGPISKTTKPTWAPVFSGTDASIKLNSDNRMIFSIASGKYSGKYFIAKNKIHKWTNAHVKRLESKMKPGDIIVSSPRGPKDIFTRMNHAVQGTPYGHAAMYVGNDMVVHARMGEGVIKDHIADFAQKNRFKVLRTNGGDKRGAVSWIKKQTGRPYSYKSLIIDGGLPSLLSRGRRGGAKAESLICSNLVASAYNKIPFTDKRSVSEIRPVDLDTSSATKTVKKIAAWEFGAETGMRR